MGLADRLPEDTRLGVSAISIWEAAMLEGKGRVRFVPDLAIRVREMIDRDLCDLVPLLPEIAIASARLRDFHGDPADRIIVAAARHLGAALVTADGKIIEWASVPERRLSILAL